VRGVLDQEQAVALTEVEQRVHAARVAGVVHAHHAARRRRDPTLDVAGIQRQVVGPDGVREDGPSAAESHGVGAGDEGQRRHDHLDSGADAERQACKVQRRGAVRDRDGPGRAA
jgi:hypothetical protein